MNAKVFGFYSIVPNIDSFLLNQNITSLNEGIYTRPRKKNTSSILS